MVPHAFRWPFAIPQIPGSWVIWGPRLLAPLVIKEVGRESPSLDLPQGQRVDPGPHDGDTSGGILL